MVIIFERNLGDYIKGSENASCIFYDLLSEELNASIVSSEVITDVEGFYREILTFDNEVTTEVEIVYDDCNNEWKCTAYEAL